MLRPKLSKSTNKTSTSCRYQIFCVCAVISRRSSIEVPPTDRESMVGLGGLEPPTSPLSGARSNHLSYRPGQLSQSLGGADRDRTDDPLLAKQVLSQLSYSPVAFSDSPHRDVRFFCELRGGNRVKPRRWWVWEDSNHRPRPYQGRALTT